MTPDQIYVLEAYERAKSPVAVSPRTPRLTAVSHELFDLGHLNISLPGWRYTINESGRAVLAARRSGGAAAAVAPPRPPQTSGGAAARAGAAQ